MQSDKKMPCKVVGYYSPVNNWNKGRRQEFKDRKTYIIKRLEDDNGHN